MTKSIGSGLSSGEVWAVKEKLMKLMQTPINSNPLMKYIKLGYDQIDGDVHL